MGLPKNDMNRLERDKNTVTRVWYTPLTNVDQLGEVIDYKKVYRFQKHKNEIVSMVFFGSVEAIPASKISLYHGTLLINEERCGIVRVLHDVDRIQNSARFAVE